MELHVMIACLLLAATVASAVPSTPHTALNLRINHQNCPDQSVSGARHVLAPKNLAHLRFEWQPVHPNPKTSSKAFEITLRESSTRRMLWTSGKILSSKTSFVADLRNATANFIGDVDWDVLWWDAQGHASKPSKPHYFHIGPRDQDWSDAQWIGNTKLLRGTFQGNPSKATVYVAGISFYQLWINGKQVEPELSLKGHWTTWNRRVLYDAFDVTPFLSSGTNAVALMLGQGWRDTNAFPPHAYTSDCDKYPRLARLMIVDDKGIKLLVTSNATNWMASDNSPITADSVYDGESYDARLEQPFSEPSFSPSKSWSGATAFDCMSAEMAPAAFPPITEQETDMPVSVHKLGCPSGMIGGSVVEGDTLDLKCADGGVMSSVVFASYGTPSGACGNFSAGTCNLSNSTEVVKNLCVGKSSCSITASNDVFGTDPCYGTPKALAVQLKGCTGAQSGPTTYVYDFGENLSGFCKISVKGKAGSSVTLKHAEVLQHPPYGPVNGSVYMGNLRSAKATDTYTLKGDPNGETYQPHFTYHGFRYVQVTATDDSLLPFVSMKRIHFRTNNSVIVNFHSSSKTLNTIQYGALRGQGSNMMSVPTDCDQRDERLGWMGDVDLSSDSFAINYDSAAFINSFLEAMANAQGSDGALPDVVPYARYGGEPADVSWSAAMPQNAYVRHQHSDDAFISSHWNALDMYMANVAKQASGGLKHLTAPYGDWVPADSSHKVSNQLCAAFNYIINAQQMAEMAQALGNSTAANTYRTLVASLQAEFNSTYYSDSSKAWDNGNQASYALAVACGAASGDAVKDSVTAIVNDINSHQNHITTGIIGAKALFPTLQQNGQASVAMALAQQTTYPSWGYMFFNDVEPATSSLWELWNSPSQGPGMNSRNHHMFSSISEWIVKHAAGLQETVCDKPMVLKATSGLGWSRASRQTPCGKVTLSYQNMGGLQCLVAPEGAAPSSSSTAPIVEDQVIDCGNQGGIIESIEFASFGKPEGLCHPRFSVADLTLTVNSSCHHPLSKSKVEALCVGKQRCEIPTHADFWSGLSCAQGAIGELRKLAVAAKCSKPSSTHVSVELPVGQQATLVLPSLAASTRVMNSGDADGHIPVSETVVDGETAVSTIINGGTTSLVVSLAPAVAS